MCVTPTGLASNFTDYPANFGEYCGVYVDPGHCDAADATKSDYFPGTLFYSYAACGDKNTYT